MVGQTTTPQGNIQPFKDICDQITISMREHHVPGAAIGIWYDGREYVAGMGITNLEHPLDVTPDTLFQIGSITKTFTATVIMQLVEQGKIDLDAPVRTYVPEFKLQDETVAQQATVRHLLTHVGGWAGDYFDDLGDGEDALAKMIKAIANLPQNTPLGKMFSYNNAGFYVAGRIIEKVTGQPYETTVRQRIFEPLGMDNAYFFARDVLTHRFVVGHNTQDDKTQVARPWAIGRAAHPAGGIVTSVKDLLKYARFHLGDGLDREKKSLISPEKLHMMHQPQVTITPDGKEKVALAWFWDEVAGLQTLSHRGGTNGQAAQFIMIPEHQFALAILTNGDNGGQVTREGWRAALRLYFGKDDPDPVPYERSLTKLEEYVGHYKREMVVIDIRLDDGKLISALTFTGGFPSKDSPPPPSPPPFEIKFFAHDRVIVTDGDLKGMQAEFIRDENEQIAWYRSGGRVAIRQKP